MKAQKTAKARTIVAVLHYNGLFDLEFLEPTWGAVRSASDGTGACEVWDLPAETWIRCEVGQWLFRDADGRLSVSDTQSFVEAMWRAATRRKRLSDRIRKAFFS